MGTSTSDEKELLARVAQGDEAAFTQLFYAYHQKLGAYVFRLTESSEVAEEIVQDVFVKIWTKRALLANVGNFGAYLYVLSRNHTLNCLRQLAKERVKSHGYAMNFHEMYENDADTNPGSDHYVLIDRAVEELPPQQQKVYLLSRRAGLKQEEIACQLSLSRETVKKYLKLATRFVSNYLRAHSNLPLLLMLLLGNLKNFF